MLETRPVELDQNVGCLVRTLVDVVFETGGGAVGERGDGEQDDDRQETDEKPHEVRGAVHPGGEQRLVTGDPVGLFGLCDGREGGADQMARGGFPLLALPRRPLLLPLLFRAPLGVRGVGRLRWLHALLLRRL